MSNNGRANQFVKLLWRNFLKVLCLFSIHHWSYPSINTYDKEQVLTPLLTRNNHNSTVHLTFDPLVELLFKK